MIVRGQVSIYDIEMDTTGRSYGLNEPVCFVRHQGYCSSLPTRVETRFLEGSDGLELWVPDTSISMIYQWAVDRGWPEEK